MKHYDDPQQTVVRAALIPYAIIAVISFVAWSVAKGKDAAVGVVVATVLVGLFFGSGFVIEKRVRELHPMAVMGAAMAGFAIKFMLLGTLLLVFRNTSLFDTNAFGITAIALSIGWLGGEVIAFTKARFLYTDAGAKSPSDD